MRGSIGGKPVRRRTPTLLVLGVIMSATLVGLLMHAPSAEAADDIDYIVIRDAPDGGGNPVGNMTYNITDTDTFYAAGYNFTSGYLGDFDAYWKSHDPNVGDVNPASGSNWTVFEALSRGTTQVDAYVPGGHLNTTGGLTVISPVDYIVIRDAPNGGGQWVGDRDYSVGDNQTCYAAGYNLTTGYFAEIKVHWYSTNTEVGVVDPTTGSNRTVFQALAGGLAQVHTYLPGGPYNTTGNLTVITPVDYIVIRDAPDGGGQPVGNMSYFMYNMDTFYAAGYNDTTGYLGDIKVHWYSFNINVGGVTPSFNNSTTFVALGVGLTKVKAYAFNGARTIANYTGYLDVSVAPPDYMIIRDMYRGMGEWVGDRIYFALETDTYYAAGYNNTHGYQAEFNATWTSSNTSVCTVTAFGEYTTFAAVGNGSCNVTAEYNGLTNVTGTIIVAPPDYIIVRDKPHGGGEWVGNRTYYELDTDTYYAAGYNNSYGYQSDVTAIWTSSNTSVCTVTASGKSTKMTAVGGGSCTVTAQYGGEANLTGTITVIPVITVDDSGGADYLTIQEAIDAASPGDRIFVYKGTYYEHVKVNKSVSLRGEDRSKTVIDGNGTGTVVSVTANNVTIYRFTIQEGYYGIFVNESNKTTILNNLIRNYTYGIYHRYTNDALVKYNTIATGAYGVVTYHSNNDAVQYNLIAYNTEFGAKDYDSTLKNCFNWNTFHYNHIAYYYDPTETLTELEFDSNILEYNDIGVKVTDASTIRVTNNTIRCGDYGIYVENGSPWIYRNVIEGVGIGIYLSNSNSKIEKNTISAYDYGIYSLDSSPKVSSNTVADPSADSVFIEGAEAVEVLDNIMDDLMIRDSAVDLLSLLGTDATIVNSTVGSISLDERSRLTVEWFLSVEVRDSKGNPVGNAIVRILEASGREVETLQTGSDGLTGLVTLTEYVLGSNGRTDCTPHSVLAEKDGAKGETIVLVSESKHIVVIFEAPGGVAEAFPWLLFFVVFGSVIALGIGGLLATEVGKLGLLSLFVPLYMKLKKEEVLDHYERGRVYQYIELNPGDHYNSIKRALSLNNGTLTHHLYVLEKGMKIRSRRDGIYKRFYSLSEAIPENNGGILSEAQKRITDTIRDLPGANQRELSSMLGMRQSTLSYQLAKLESAGIIYATRVGRNANYYLSTETDPHGKE